jgi:hypothetical protein
MTGKVQATTCYSKHQVFTPEILQGLGKKPKKTMVYLAMAFGNISIWTLAMVDQSPNVISIL